MMLFTGSRFLRVNFGVLPALCFVSLELDLPRDGLPETELLEAEEARRRVDFSLFLSRDFRFLSSFHMANHLTFVAFEGSFICCTCVSFVTSIASPTFELTLFLNLWDIVHSFWLPFCLSVCHVFNHYLVIHEVQCLLEGWSWVLDKKCLLHT